ncbi:MAG: hypothetical protein SF069_00685 [Phycisphaerae bacterium]|nr:hypothetical protein [Phycisphaerae bacterium]
MKRRDPFSPHWPAVWTARITLAGFALIIVTALALLCIPAARRLETGTKLVFALGTAMTFCWYWGEPVFFGISYLVRLLEKSFAQKPAPNARPCPHCGYDVSQNKSGRCSECGTAFDIQNWGD